jgi:hypothetical protein
LSEFSTVFTHEAQCIPVISRRILADFGTTITV